MQLWTTFTPRKVSWEMTFVLTAGKNPSSDWVKNFELITESLEKLKTAGIYGIRLVVYPSEITKDGKKFNWKPIEKILDLCWVKNIKVDLCIGPFQYPNYPGVYLPVELHRYFSANRDEGIENLDDDPQLYQYGLDFLKKQMDKFGDDKRVNGFHFANEWPDKQRVEGRRDLEVGVSEKFMIECANVLKQKTKKPILLNTNIEIFDQRKVKKTFGKIINILNGRIKLGFDIYPTQNKWKKVPFTKFRSLILNYSKSFKSLQKKLGECEIYFAEVEAQPWGSGQSWYKMISSDEKPQEKILNYYKSCLKHTFEKYIKNSNSQLVSLWGSDFWLIAQKMGIKWPIDQISLMKNNFTHMK